MVTVCHHAANGELQHFLADLHGNTATKENFELDAQSFEKIFARDVRFLSHHGHDHDCSGTRVKSVKKRTKEQLAKLLMASHAPPCRFDFFLIVMLAIAGKRSKIRRRGKELVDSPYILSTTSWNQFGVVAFERPQTFRSAFSDCGLAALRRNNDFRLMPRGFAITDALVEAFRCDDNTLAACLRKFKSATKAHAAVARMVVSIVALHVAAAIVDYYITKNAAKPREQLQNLTTQYALGMRRLEDKQTEQKSFAGNSGGNHPASSTVEKKTQLLYSGSSAECSELCEVGFFDRKRSVRAYGSIALDES